ncbi:hypothetical protein ACJX0J_020710, partial [Zea mays]
KRPYVLLIAYFRWFNFPFAMLIINILKKILVDLWIERKISLFPSNKKKQQVHSSSCKRVDDGFL